MPLFTRNACVKVIFFWNFWCSAKEAAILFLSWSTLYIAISKCIKSWFYFVLLLSIHPERLRKSNFFLKFLVLHERSSNIDSFVVHPVYSIFIMCNILILVSLFWFATVHPKWVFKSRKVVEAVVLLYSWSTQHLAFLKCKGSFGWCLYSDLSLLTRILYIKVIYSGNFRCFAKETVIFMYSRCIAFAKHNVSWF